MPSRTPPVDDLDKRALLALVEASRLVNEGTDLQDVFCHVTEAAARVMRAEASSLLTLDEQRAELVFRASFGPAAGKLVGTRMPADRGIAGQAVRTGRAVRVDDVRQNVNFFEGIDLETEMRTSSLLAVPLIAGERTVGVIEVLNPIDRETFTDDDLKLLQVFANLAAMAMRNAEKLDHSLRENRARRASSPALPIIGDSDAIRTVIEMCERVAAVNTTVLIVGETGVGKEVAARHIHDRSRRKDSPFIAVNCAALSQTLIESELFGHERGAFTGAEQRRAGWFELAEGGTLFLDEVGELAASTQGKLLRVLQEGEFSRVGGTEIQTCDVRVLAATNRNLHAEVKAGRFREDLFYRLNVFPIEVPPLRVRREDIPAIARHLLRRIAADMSVEPPPELNADVICALKEHSWPGNVRELRNALERCMLLAGGRIAAEHLPREICEGCSAEAPAAVAAAPSPTAGSLHDQERALILQALEKAKWNRTEAARRLGVTRDVLRYRMKKYGLTPPEGAE